MWTASANSVSAWRRPTLNAGAAWRRFKWSGGRAPTKSTAARSNSTASRHSVRIAGSNNQLGRTTDGSLAAPRNFLIRNQFGARVGAPIRRNKTFIFFLYEAQRQKTKTAVNTTVFTASALKGDFRFYPNVRNGNATAAVPTVDLNGNPVTPVGASGPLQTVSLSGRDPSGALNSRS